MHELLGLLTGYTPVMVFIFLCFAVLVVMFYLVLRSLDDLTAGIREERNALMDQVSGVKLQMEELIRVQAEARDLLRAMLGPVEAAALVQDSGLEPELESRPLESSGKQEGGGAPRQGSKGLDSENITKFIVAE